METENQDTVARDGTAGYFDGLKDATRATVPALGTMDAEERELFLKELGKGASESVKRAAFVISEKRRLASRDDPTGCENLAAAEMQKARQAIGIDSTRHVQAAQAYRDRSAILRQIQSCEDGISRMTREGRVNPDGKARLDAEIARLRARLAKDD